MTEQPPYQGACLCGNVRFEIDTIQPNMAHCHCSMCRKFHGAAFSTYAEVKQEDFRWTKGEDLLASYTAHNGSIRRFCMQCGSSLAFQTATTAACIEIALGVLDGPIKQQPDAHVYVASKADWDVICDHLPQFTHDRISRQANKD